MSAQPAPRYIQSDWFGAHIFNPFVKFLTGLGLSVYGSRVLEVRGRVSGQTRSVVVNPLEHGGNRYLVAPRGTTQWVRNLRAVRTADLRLGRRRETVSATEIADADKVEILRAYLRRWRFEIGQFFQGVGPDASDAELEGIAPDYPIFRLTTAS